MNAEDFAREAAERARLAEAHAKSATTAAMRSAASAKEAASSATAAYQSHGNIERESRETRALVTLVRKEMREGFEALNTAIFRAPVKRAKREHFNPTDTGNHAIVPIAELDQLMDDRKTRDEAQAYRRQTSRVRKVLWAGIIGAATIGGEQALKYLLGLLGHH